MTKAWLVVMVVMVSASTPAQSVPTAKPAEVKAAEAMPTVDQVLEKYVQALGGRSALQKVSSRISKGTFEIPTYGSHASEEIYEKAPNKSVSITNDPNYGVVRLGFNGSVGWQEDPDNGLREFSGAQLATLKRNSDFYRDLNLKQLYVTMTLKSREKVGNHEAYVVEATPADGSPEQMYFDKDNGLLILVKATREGQQGRVQVGTSYEDYREVDGIKLPFRIHQSRPGFSFIIRLSEVQHNVPIDDAKFEKPAAEQH
jgi:zinc protease